MATKKADAIRQRSKRLFGNRYMLEVTVAVGSAPGRVGLTDLAEAASVSPSVYSGPLNRLVEFGLLVPVERGPADDHRARWYRRAESSLWAASSELLP